MPHSTRAPLLRLAYQLTWALSALLLVSSVLGLRFGGRGFYDMSSPTGLTFLSQDATTLLLLPLFVRLAWLAMRGALGALVLWIGALFYVAYSYFFYVIGAKLSPLLPLYIATVSIGMYGALTLLFTIDASAFSARFRARLPARVIGGYLMTLALLFATLWLGLIVSDLFARREIDAVGRAVIAIDGVVLLPLLFVGGLWLWQRRPLGFLLAGVLLSKAAATFVTLVIATAVTWRAGHPVDAVQSTAFVVNLIIVVPLLIIYQRNIQRTDVVLPFRDYMGEVAS